LLFVAQQQRLDDFDGSPAGLVLGWAMA